MAGPAAGALRVLVTRPAQDAQLWVKPLRQAGFNAVALPLIEIAALEPAPQSLSLSLTAPAYDALMFVSGNAAECFFKQKEAADQYARAPAAINNGAISSLPAPRFLAPGPGTASALLAAGVPASQIDAPPPDAGQFDSEALWQVIGKRDWKGRRVLIVRGQSRGAEGGAAPGRDWLSGQFQCAGAEVDTLAVYERLAPHLSDAQVALATRACADGSVWLFSSSEAVANLARQPGLQGLPWAGGRAIATHPRIATSLGEAGWSVVVQSRPALRDILSCLRSIESAYP